MSDHSRIWNVLWSYQQNALHVESMDQTLKEGMEALQEDRETQYVLVATGLTRGEASDFYKHWHDILHVRQIAKDAKRSSPFDGVA
jgi:arabinogalactan endo-1,4-beta-galactosidase